MPEKIDADLVRHIGLLSRLELTDEQTAVYQNELAPIVEHFEKLSQLDDELGDVQPMAHAVELTNVLADDVPGESLSTDDALANASGREGEFFGVPKVLGGES